jgi:hypothetical protein
MTILIELIGAAVHRNDREVRRLSGITRRTW